MFDERSLRELASVKANGPILSIYLDVDPTKRTADEYKLTLRDLLKQVNGAADPADVEAVKRYVDLEYDRSGRGLVMFSRTAEDIWHVFPLSLPVHSGITLARKPYISPLVELNGIYGRYVVAQVDKQGARFFIFHMGDMLDYEGTVGEDIHHTRKGRGSSVVGMRGGAPASGRKEAELVQRNLKDSAIALAEFCREHRPYRLLLTGSEHTLAQFQEFLPASLKDILVGTFPAEMEAGEVELREHALAVLEELSLARQHQLAEAIITAAAKGQNGVLGLDQTLSIAHDGRIQTLVVERNYHAPGYQCGSCGYLTTQPLEKCVFCSSDVEKIADAVEAAVGQVVEKNGTVEVVNNHVIGESRIGALLRY
ncbi:MAG: hypothetical protein JXA21_20480 [Anaerolineae bacterium]|nr:hypothetical protein [Anaerolineae bacterium]